MQTGHRKSLRYSLMATLMAVLAGVAMVALAQDHPCATAFDPDAALAVESFADGVVAVQPAAADPAEIEVVHYRESDACEPQVIDHYPIEGGAPRLEEVFLHHYHGWPVLVSIVSWPHQHRGLGMTGRFYSIYVYHRDGDSVQLNEALARLQGLSGVVGTTEDWEQMTFAGVHRLGAAALLDLLAPPSEQELGWQELCKPEGKQMELNACAIVTLGEAQQALNAMLVRVSESYADHPSYLAEFTEAQDSWRRQIRADLTHLFPLEPGQDPRVQYGSSYTMQHTLVQAYLLRQRTEYLGEFWVPMN